MRPKKRANARRPRPGHPTECQDPGGSDPASQQGRRVTLRGVGRGVFPLPGEPGPPLASGPRVLRGRREDRPAEASLRPREAVSGGRRAKKEIRCLGRHPGRRRRDARSKRGSAKPSPPQKDSLLLFAREPREARETERGEAPGGRARLAGAVSARRGARVAGGNDRQSGRWDPFSVTSVFRILSSVEKRAEAMHVGDDKKRSTCCSSRAKTERRETL